MGARGQPDACAASSRSPTSATRSASSRARRWSPRREWHHPDIELGWGRAAFELTTHAASGLTRNDFVMAAKIDRLAGGRCVVSLEAEMLALIKAGRRAPQRHLPDAGARDPAQQPATTSCSAGTELFGLPVEPRDDIPPKRFRIDCPGSRLRDRGGDRRGGRRAAAGRRRRPRRPAPDEDARRDQSRSTPSGSRPSRSSLSRCASSVSAAAGRSAGGSVVPDLVEQLVACARRPRVERRDQPPLAVEAVLDVLASFARGSQTTGPWPGQSASSVERAQASQRLEVARPASRRRAG